MLSPRDLLLPANLLSSTRLLLGPAFLLVFDPADRTSIWICLGIMIVAEITDLLDGWTARRFRHVSDLGKLLDPMADSIYRFLVFLALFGAGWMAAWMICAIFVRDIVVAYTRIFSAVHGVVLAARFSGKAKAVVQGIAQIGVMVLIVIQGSLPASLVHGIAQGLLIAATLVTAYSAVDYVIGASRDAARITGDG